MELEESDHVVDKEDFGPFTETEVEECFKAFDLDNNNFIATDEILEVYKAMGKELTDDDVDEMMRMCDQNRDGQVSMDEFKRMVFRHSGPPLDENRRPLHLHTPSSTSQRGKRRRPITSERSQLTSKHTVETMELASPKSLLSIQETDKPISSEPLPEGVPFVVL